MDNTEVLTINNSELINNLLDPGETYVLKVEGSFTMRLKAQDRFIIAGYANVELRNSGGDILPDLDNDNIDLKALDEAFHNMMSIHSRRNLMAWHSSVQIGEIKPKYTDTAGVTWESGVKYNTSSQYPKRGLFIIAEIFQDIIYGKRYSNLMRQDKMLAFSIGGLPIDVQRICNNAACFNNITKIELYEVSSCNRGKNVESKGFVLKAQLEQPNTPPILAGASDGANLIKALIRDSTRKTHERT